MNDQMNIIDDSGDKKYFTIVPNYILNHSSMWDREVYIQMKRITGESGTCWTSRNTLAKQCGISPRRLDKSLKYLTEHNWIDQIGRKKITTAGGPQEVNEYRIADLWKLNIDYYENDKGIAPETPPLINDDMGRYGTDDSKGIAHGATKEEPLYKEEQYLITFDRFWLAYPRKISKKKASQAWLKIKPDGGLVEEILKKLEYYKLTEQWSKDNGQFIPHPTTWLNQERWNDEIEIVPKVTRRF